MFYLFDQNNSGGYFIVDNKLCHRLFIEAESSEEAVSIAEKLGCYWDGVDKKKDCPCCGDRWYKNPELVNIEKWRTEGYRVNIYDGIYDNTIKEYEKRYGKYESIRKPKFENSYDIRYYAGSICFRDIEEYAQYLSDEFGCTIPDARIFYKDGNVKEICSSRKKWII